MSAPNRWYIVTGEYPPDHGGVADYTCRVAEGLAHRGDQVTVLAPRGKRLDLPESEYRNGVRLTRLPGKFGLPGLRAMRSQLEREPPGGRLLVQYVPHALGWRAMNVALCVWLAAQRRHRLWLMIHEVAYPRVRGQRWRHALLALVNRWMVCRLAASAERILVSTASWGRSLASLCRSTVAAEWAPIPSNFDSPSRPPAPSRLPPKGIFQLGHFGTFAPWTMDALEKIMPAVLHRCPNTRILFLGRKSDVFARSMAAAHPEWSDRIRGAGELSPDALTVALQTCHLMLQPFPDGISTRRTSAMCSLALGLPVLTQIGEQTEPIWQESGALRLIMDGNAGQWATEVAALLDAPQILAALGEAGGRLYKERFSLERTLDQLQTFPPTPLLLPPDMR